MDMTNWAKVARELERGLPKSRNKRRCRLLPKILRDWSQTDLHEHLLLKSRTEIRAKIKKLETVKKNALQLRNALNEVDEAGLADIVFQMAIAERGGSYTPGMLGKTFAKQIDRLREELEFLAKLAAIAPDKYWQLTPEQRVTSAYLVLKDAAAIYEWLTGRRATREVDRDDHFEKGPFFHFVETLWPVVFRESAPGLENAMKNWASARSRFRERSPVLFNINSRHPTWGISGA